MIVLLLTLLLSTVSLPSAMAESEPAQSDLGDWLALPSEPAVSMRFVVSFNSGLLSATSEATPGCALITQMLQNAHPGIPDPVCQSRFVSTADSQMLRSVTVYDYHLHLETASDRKSMTIQIHKNPDRVFDEFDVKYFEWTLGDSDARDRLVTLSKILNRVLFFETHPALIRSFLVAQGIRAESSSHIAIKEGNFVDTHTGIILTSSEAITQFAAENHRQKHYLRAGIQSAAILGMGALLYWGPGRAVTEDKDYDSGELGKKLSGDGYRFDHNAESINAFGHAIQGAYMYLGTRTNGFNSFESFLVAFAGSAIWESVIELREHFSINDQIITPVAGAAIGEAMFQLGDYFASTEHTVLAGFSNPYQNLFNEIFSGDQSKRRRDASRLGFDEKRWHDFSISSALGAGEAGALGLIGIKLDLTQLPEYAKSANLERFVRDTAFTQIVTEAKLNTNELRELKASFFAALAGYHQYHARRDNDQNLIGSSFFIGPSTRYDITVEIEGKTHAWFAQVHVLGASMNYTHFFKGGFIRATIEMYPDFAIIHSYSWDKYLKNHTDEGARSVLQYHDSYYAYGASLIPGVTIQYLDYMLDLRLTQSWYQSIDARDRRQERITVEQELCDSITDVSAKISRSLFDLPIYAFLRGDYRKISSCIKGPAFEDISAAHERADGFVGLEVRWK